MDQEFWRYLDRLVAASQVEIDRPKGSAHPRFPDLIYPLDYGYLQGTTTIDGGGIDVFFGSQAGRPLDAVALTVDLEKRDAEIKLLLGCSEEEKQIVAGFSERRFDARLPGAARRRPGLAAQPALGAPLPATARAG